MNSKIFSCLVFILVAIVIYIKQAPFVTDNKENLKECYFDILKNSSSCNLRCPYGKFALPGMTNCHDWLSCMDEIEIISTISISVVKSVYLAKWNEYEVAVSVLSSKLYEEDFKQNLFMLKSLSPNDKVVKLIGYCTNAIITKYYHFGSALNANYHLKYTLQRHDNMKTRLNLCVSYTSIIHFLHSSPVGVRVMCDSSSLEKTLSQYLLTESFEVVANDLDATPEVNSKIKKGIICGKKILYGTFVAPEQKWPFSDELFDVQKMIPYDEKTDIWKIPDVCNWFLGDSSTADFLKYKLFSIHKQCKSLDPSKRPNSSHVLDTYQKVLNDL